MKRYIAHMKRKPPHERRQHALSLAGGVTAMVLVGWLVTLGLRLGTAAPSAAQQTAAAGNALTVASSTSDWAGYTSLPADAGDQQ